MKKYFKEILSIIILIIILIVILMLIYLKKTKIEKINYDLTDTKWILDNAKNIPKDSIYESIELEFFEGYVSVCGIFSNGGSACSLNNLIKNSKIYKIEQNDTTNIFGTIKFDKNENIYLEQENTNTIYNFKKA